MVESSDSDVSWMLPCGNILGSISSGRKNPHARFLYIPYGPSGNIYLEIMSGDGSLGHHHEEPT